MAEGTNFKITIPYHAKWIIHELGALGYKAYVVGGCVRDSLLRRKPKDWDICTNATPEAVIDIFRNRKVEVIETGLQHGTVTLHFITGDYEVTTFRVDGEYSDGRHPDSVEFIDDITADLARRDFTINAMAYNDEDGLIDPFGGAKDLRMKLIRCVGDPDKRFQEDSLRILRAMRFASTYKYQIVSNTISAMNRNRHLLCNISAERICNELCRMLHGENILYVLLQYCDIIAEIIPELRECIGFEQNNPYHKYDVYEHIAHAVAEYKGGDISIKVALLLHDIGKPRSYVTDERGRGHFYGHPAVGHEMAKHILERLKFDNKTRDEILELVLYHDVEIKASRRVARRLLSKIGVDRVKQLILVKRSDILSHSEKAHGNRLETLYEFASIVDDIIAENECFTIKDLAVNGHDICALGVSGPIVGRVLNYLLDRVIDETLENDHGALIMEAKIFIGEEI